MTDLPDGAIVGRSAPIRRAVERIERVGSTEARVLIRGENGTGKELAARALHRQSGRSDGPFVALNCAAIPPELVESELFGHVEGAFTGATADREGTFRRADGGTLFLDEVGDMSLAAQARVLRALQEGRVTPLGSEASVEVDVRIVTATHRDLEREVAEGRFRDDLYYRLNVVPLRLPPLRERREDIPLLVRHFAERAAVADGLPPRRFDEGALRRLAEHPWPGNVRELRNAVERLLVLAPDDPVGPGDVERLVPAEGDGGRAGGGDPFAAGTFDEFRERAERTFLLRKLREHGWNVAETARRLDIARSNLYRKMRRYGLRRDE